MNFRNDDILVVNYTSPKMKFRMYYKRNFFERFLEGDKLFEKYNHPCTLAVLSEGIGVYPEWVEYIKNRLHRFTIELHGSSHHYYQKFTADEGYKDLLEAKKRIEDAFSVKVSRWIVPFKKYPDWGLDVCKQLGIGFDRIQEPERLFHYWNRSQVEKTNRTLQYIYEQ